MSVEQFRGYVVASTAAIIAIGCVILGVTAWNQPIDPDNPKDLAIIIGFLTGAFTLAANHLFTGESNTQAARATERAVAITPGTGTEPGQTTTTTTTNPPADAPVTTTITAPEPTAPEDNP